MISNRKKLIYASVFVLTGSLFAHELVRATSAQDLPEPLELPAELPQTTAGPALEPSGAQSDPQSVSSTESAQPQPTAAVEAGSVDAVLRSLEAALGGATGGVEQDEVAPRARRARRQRQIEDDTSEELALAPQPELTAPVEPPAPPPRASRAERADRLARLLDADPLLGLIRGGGESVALFSSGAVRAGERWAAGDALVLSCEERGVRIEFDGEPTWVPLPSLKTRARASSSLTGGGAEPVAPVQSAGPSAAASPTTIPAGGAQ